jgi:uncharacterized protein (TIGR01777 family)
VKRILVTGGTGFVGRALVRALRARGDAVTVLSRDPVGARRALGRGVRVAHWEPRRPGPWCDELGTAEAVVHLAGAPIARRWTARYRIELEESRVTSTRLLVEAIGRARRKPAALVSASATGFYGADRPDEVEEGSAPASDFLGGLCQRWEEAARGAEEHGLRTVLLRTGVVLGPSGGALAKMVGPGRAFVGGPIGRGDNWMSWVHLDDAVGMALWAIDDEGVRGAVNVTSPYYVTARDLATTAASVLGRPRLGMPEAAARIVFGDAVDVMVGSLRAEPRRAIEAGYEYHHARIVPALAAALAA